MILLDSIYIKDIKVFCKILYKKYDKCQISISKESVATCPHIIFGKGPFIK